ncbi:uncharacterized protein LOC105205342 [Solenopsis invicta]|uniref:uncharacterized protein LOC105205342 n=1 Tax=Solenopsis invicta TaxID=13686 RepID=UPI00059624F6|nr:uncharacterized protein LOC105205342 [Solenopsis invicta]
MICSLKSEDSLSKDLERFWKLESYDDNKIGNLSFDEMECERHLERNTTREDDGRFIVRLPFRKKNKLIGNNKEIALRRLYQLERRFKGNNAFYTRYAKFMSEYIELGHMSIASKPLDNCENMVYLPHHGVLKESSSSNKLRVVFDASFKNSKATSLNDALFVGPTLQDNLVDIVIRFRFYDIAITADLQKMYRQVSVHSDDPIRCLRQLATEGSECYPLATQALLNDTYLDDIITGANTIKDAQILQKQLVNLLSKRKFEAHKWCSNSSLALKNVLTELLELCSAVLLARLINNVKRTLTVPIDEIRAWSDSMVVLYWLRGDSNRWKPFVGNQVSEITDILPAIHWRHVKSSENPADLISRGATPTQLLDNSLWWHGPKWLCDPPVKRN